MPEHKKTRNHLDQSPSSHPDSASKRIQARTQLTSRLLVRNSGHIQKACPECQPGTAGTPDLTLRRWSAQSRSRVDKRDPERDTGESGTSRYVTLSQAYDLLGPLWKKRSVGDWSLPDIRVRIIPVSRSCQSIKLTVNHRDPFKRNATSDAADRSRSAVLRPKDAVRDRDTSARKPDAPAPRTASGRSRIEELISEVDRNQLRADELILRWLAENPLGADADAEYEPISGVDRLDDLDTRSSKRPELPSITADARSLITLTSTTTTDASSTPTKEPFRFPRWPQNAALQTRKPNQPIGSDVEPDSGSRDRIPSTSLDKLNLRDRSHDNMGRRKKSVRFGSRDWIIKDDNYFFN